MAGTPLFISARKTKATFSKGTAKKKTTEKSASGPSHKFATAADVKKHGATEYIRVGQYDRTGIPADPPDLPMIYLVVIKRVVGQPPKVAYMKVETRICNGISIGDVENAAPIRLSSNNWIKYDSFFMRLFDNHPIITGCATWLLNNDYHNPPRPGDVLLGHRGILPAPGMLFDAPGKFNPKKLRAPPSGTPKDPTPIEFMLSTYDHLTDDESLELPGDWRADMRSIDDEYSDITGFIKDYLRIGRMQEWSHIPDRPGDYYGEPRLFQKPLAGTWDLELWVQPQGEGCVKLFDYSADKELCLNSLMDRNRSSDERIGRSLYVEVRVVPKKRKGIASEKKRNGKLWEGFKTMGLAKRVWDRPMSLDVGGDGEDEDQEDGENEKIGENSEDEVEVGEEDEDSADFEEEIVARETPKRKRTSPDRDGPSEKIARRGGAAGIEVLVELSRKKHSAELKDKAKSETGIAGFARTKTTRRNTSKRIEGRIRVYAENEIVPSIEILHADAEMSDQDMPDADNSDVSDDIAVAHPSSPPPTHKTAERYKRTKGRAEAHPSIIAGRLTWPAFAKKKKEGGKAGTGTIAYGGNGKTSTEDHDGLAGGERQDTDEEMQDAEELADVESSGQLLRSK